MSKAERREAAIRAFLAPPVILHTTRKPSRAQLFIMKLFGYSLYWGPTAQGQYIIDRRGGNISYRKFNLFIRLMGLFGDIWSP